MARTGAKRNDRGTTAVVATVFLMGMVVVTGTGILVLGTQTLDEAAHAAEIDRAEKSFVALDGKVEAVAHSTSGDRVIDLGLPEGTDGVVHRDGSGRIVVEAVEAGDREELANRSIGTVEYRNQGTVVAYQGGGVWRGDGANAWMVSAPEMEYREGTLTFPVVDLHGKQPLTTDRFAIEDNRTVAPLTDVQAVEDSLVVVRITSDYYGGWASYLEQRIDTRAVSVDHANQTVIAELGQPDIDGEFAPGLVSGGGDVTVSAGATVDSRIRTSGSVHASGGGNVVCDGGTGDDCYTEDATIDRTTLDWGIGRKVEAANGTAPEPTLDAGTPVELEAGTYFVEDGAHVQNNDVVFDLSDGNVTLVVDGNLGISSGSQFVVRADDVGENCCYARVYTTGDVAIANGNAGVSVVGTDAGNATRFQLYGTSEMQFGIGQGDFTGVVYAPRDDPANGTNDAVEEYGLASATASCDDDVDACIGQGNGVVRGGVVAGPTSVGQATTLQYDDDLRTVDPTLDLGDTMLPPDVTYLHLSVHEVDLDPR